MCQNYLIFNFMVEKYFSHNLENNSENAETPDNTEKEKASEIRRKRYGVDKKKALLATALSIGVHAGGVEYAIHKDKVDKDVSSIIHKAKLLPKNLKAEAHELFENLKKENIDLHNLQTIAKEGKKYTNEALGIKGISFETDEDGGLKIPETEMGNINWPHFYFQKEIKRGIISPEEAAEKEKALEDEVAEYKKLDESLSNKSSFEEKYAKVAYAILQNQGEYDYKNKQPYLAGMIPTNEGEIKRGDCKARIKRLISIFTKLYPDVELKAQISADPHRRLIANFGNDVYTKWYVIEGVPHPLTEEEMKGTVIVSIMNFLSSELHNKKQGSFNPSDTTDSPGEEGVDDGFDLLPGGMKPTKKVFTETGSQPQEAKKTFEQAKAEFENTQKQELLVSYLDAEDLEINNDKNKNNEDQIIVTKLSPQEIVDIHINRKFEKISSFISSDPDLRRDAREREEWDKFSDPNTSHAEKKSMIERHIFDLSSLEKNPLKQLKIEGYKVDLRQLKDVSELTEITLRDCMVEGLEVLVKAEKLKKFVWDGKYSPDYKGVEKILENKQKLSDLTLENYQGTDLAFLKNTKLKQLTLFNTAISDLAFLKDQSLVRVQFNHTPIRDVSVLKDRIDKEQIFITDVRDYTYITPNYTFEINNVEGVELSASQRKKYEKEIFEPNFDYDKKDE